MQGRGHRGIDGGEAPSGVAETQKRHMFLEKPSVEVCAEMEYASV
jgi:hypothetical protein